MKRSRFPFTAGFTLVEVVVASVVTAFAIAAVFSGAISVQRCFAAGKEFAEDKKNQSRLSDFLSLDLRRALTITPGTGNNILTITIPDFYDASGEPRMPTIIKYVAEYGDPTKPITITYEKKGSSIFRKEGAEPEVEIATDVVDFKIEIEDLEKSVKTHVSFAPHFSRANAGSTTAVASTALHSTTYLRNKRKDTK